MVFFDFVMDRPVQRMVSLLGLLALATADVRTEENAAPPKRERSISPRVAEMLSAASPKFEPAAPPATTTDVTDVSRPRLPAPEITKPANTIIRLPEYIVREVKPRRLPKEEEVMVPRDLEKLAMKEFIGPEDGFDRGFLNLFTVPQFWKKIPLLGKIPLKVWETNEERAMRMYRADREAKAWAEAWGMLALGEKLKAAGPAPSASPEK